MNNNFWIYLAVMFIVTYAVRVVPLALIRKKIENKFLRSFLYYIPYTVLGAMTFPAILYSVDNMIAAAAGTAAALIFAFAGKGLLAVAASASIAVYIFMLIF